MHIYNANIVPEVPLQHIFVIQVIKFNSYKIWKKKILDFRCSEKTYVQIRVVHYLEWNIYQSNNSHLLNLWNLPK